MKLKLSFAKVAKPSNTLNENNCSEKKDATMVIPAKKIAVWLRLFIF